jgi:hypothetical protein
MADIKFSGLVDTARPKSTTDVDEIYEWLFTLRERADRILEKAYCLHVPTERKERADEMLDKSVRYNVGPTIVKEMKDIDLILSEAEELLNLFI